MNNIFTLALGIAIFLADPTLATDDQAFSKSQAKIRECQNSSLALTKLDKREVVRGENLNEELKVLDLSNNPKLTSYEIKNLTNLTTFNELRLNYTNIDNLGLFYLRGFTQLKVLNLSNNPGITSVGIKKLITNLINLEILSFGSYPSIKKISFGAPTLDDFFKPGDKNPYLSSLLPESSELSKLKRVVSYYDEICMKRIDDSNLWFLSVY